MSPSVLLALVIQHGPAIVGLVSQLSALKNAGDKPLTPADFEQLAKYASKTSADYLREAQS